MKKISFVGLMALAIVGSPAQAVTLTFDGLTASCLVPGNCGLTGNNNQVVYNEGGYILTFDSPPPSGPAHISDGTFVTSTYNWHDGPANAVGSILTLSKSGGGLFDLFSLDFATSLGLTVSASGYAPLLLTGSGTSTPEFLNVVSVSFSGPGTNQLDNIEVAAAAGAVPEPAIWAMMLVGFGLIGGAMRGRKQHQSTRFAYS